MPKAETRAELEAEINAERAEQIKAVIPSTAAEHAVEVDALLERWAKATA